MAHRSTVIDLPRETAAAPPATPEAPATPAPVLSGREVVDTFIASRAAEAQTISEDLRRTLRVLRTDWDRAGRDPSELARALDPQAPEGAADALALPLPLALGISRARAMRARLDALIASPEVREALSCALDARAAALRLAVRLHRDDLEASAKQGEIDALLAHAARSGRRLTPAEHEHIDAVLADAARVPEASRAPAGVAPPSVRGSAAEALGALRVREVRRQLRSGLLRSEQMVGLIRAAIPALYSGAPILLLGETGGAKTALAEHLAAHTGKRPEFVSGYGDISAAQLVGTHELRTESGATVTAFEPGPMLRAMRDGRPLILDEVNAMPPEFLKRLNRVLQLRPGDRFSVQEQAGLVIDIAPGFVVLATANEHDPGRYRGIEAMSAELVNRFGANAYRVHYPDAGLGYSEYPRENAVLAAAALADDSGELPPGLTAEHVERAARAAFISQQVFSGNHGEGFDRFIGTDRGYDRGSGLEETVIAPRTLVAILERVALEGTEAALIAAFRRFVDGVMHAEDRRVLTLILSGQGLLG